MAYSKDMHGLRIIFIGGHKCEIIFGSVRIWECN